MRKQGKQKPSTHTTVLCYYGHPFYLHFPEAGLPKYPGLVVGTLKQPLPSLQGVYTRTMAGPLQYKSLQQHCRFKHIHHLESTRFCSVPLAPYQLTLLLGPVTCLVSLPPNVLSQDDPQTTPKSSADKETLCYHSLVASTASEKTDGQCPLLGVLTTRLESNRGRLTF